MARNKKRSVKREEKINTNVPKQVHPQKLSKKNVLSLGVLTFVLTLLTFLYPVLTDYLSDKFNGNISLGILNEKIPENEPVFIFFSTPKNDRKATYIVPIQLTIFNEFKNAEEGVSLVLKYSKENNRSVLKKEYMIHWGNRTEKEVSHELNSSNFHDYSVYKIDYLTKKGKYSITDGAFTSIIEYEHDFPILFEMPQGINVQATLYSKKDIERTWDLRYRAVNVRPSKNLEWWVMDYYSKNIALDLRRTKTFFQYLSGLLFGKEITVYGFQPNFIYIPEKNLFLPKEDVDRYNGFRFDPYLWKLLFDFE